MADLRDLAIDVVTKSAGQFDMEPLSLTDGNRNSLMTPKGDLAVCSTEGNIQQLKSSEGRGKKTRQNKNHHNNLEIHVLVVLPPEKNQFSTPCATHPLREQPQQQLFHAAHASPAWIPLCLL